MPDPPHHREPQSAATALQKCFEKVTQEQLTGGRMEESIQTGAAGATEAAVEPPNHR